MEILLIQKKIVLLFLCFLYVGLSSGQTNLFIFNAEGSAKVIDKTDTIRAYKGCPIKENQKIVLAAGDSVVYINENGIDFELSSEGEYSYKKLVKSKPTKDQTSFVKKFFTYVWGKFKDLEGDTRSKSGVVYRGDTANLMQYPINNVRLYNSEVSFNWLAIDNKEKDYFLVLKNMNSENYTVIGTPSNSLRLNIDNVLLKKGETYQWTITETKFFNPAKLNFYEFTLLDESSFALAQKELASISKYLKSLGLSDESIKNSFCEDYKTCF